MTENELLAEIASLEVRNPTRIQGTCLNCRFSGQGLHDHYGDPLVDDEDRDGIDPCNVTVICRRYPPAFLPGRRDNHVDSWRQPIVYTDDVCGEWQAS